MRITVKLGAAILMCAVSASSATVYDYSAGGLSDSPWQLEKHDAGYINAIYAMSRSSSVATFSHVHADAQGFPSRAAVTWVAPAGEVITSVAFHWYHDLDPAAWQAVAYVMDSAEALSGSSSVGWAETTCATGGGDAVLSFAATEDVQKVGLGFATPAYSSYGWIVQFSGIVITTSPVPEPMTIAFLALGVVAGVRRRLV